MPEVGDLVRVIAIHRADNNPQHRVGDTFILGKIQHGVSYVFDGWALAVESGQRIGTWCKLEVIPTAAPSMHDAVSAPAHSSEFETALDAQLARIRAMLLAKNAAYGDSVSKPLRVFSTASNTEQIRVRIDDKLSRLARGSAAGEDVVLDLVGYLLILMMQEGKSK